ncbi:MAG: hypothetical protein ORN53_04485 [Crocinitomicaceae bacterium]|nr:hypothetical protein [Crocinitomicaceae bacterium]
MIKFIQNKIHTISFEELNIPMTLEQVVLLVNEKIIGEHTFEFEVRGKAKDINYTGKRNGPNIEIQRSLDRVSNILMYPTAKISFTEVNGETELKATFELHRYYNIGIVSFYCLLFIGLIVDSYLLETLLKRMAMLLFHVAVFLGFNSLIQYHHRNERKNILLILNQVLQDQTKNAAEETLTEELPKVETVPQTGKPKLFGHVFELVFILLIALSFYHAREDVRFIDLSMLFISFFLIFGYLFRKLKLRVQLNLRHLLRFFLVAIFVLNS